MPIYVRTQYRVGSLQIVSLQKKKEKKLELCTKTHKKKNINKYLKDIGLKPIFKNILL